MPALTTLTSADASRIGAELAGLGEGAQTMEQVASKIVRHLYDNLIDDTGARSLALARFYLTHPYRGLDSGLQKLARGVLGGPLPSENINCLTMLATMGENPDWTDRLKSKGHRAIPFANSEMIASIPMISALLSQFGVAVQDAIRDRSHNVALANRAYGVFHVREARGSEYIPAQDDFVIRYGVKSVAAFGGVLSSGDLFVTIMFSKATISDDVSQSFEALGPKVKEAVDPFATGRIFN